MARVLAQVGREDYGDVARSSGAARRAAHEVAGFKKLKDAVLGNEADRAGYENSDGLSQPLSLLDAVRVIR